MAADLKEGYMYGEEAIVYMPMTLRKLSLYRKYGLVKSVKVGRHFLYKKEWLDEFAEEWAGYDISSEEKLRLAIKAKEWKKKNGYKA